MGDDTKQLFKHLFAGNTQLWAIAVLLFVTSAVIIFSAIAQRAYGHPVNYLIPYERHLSILTPIRLLRGTAPCDE